MTTIEAVWDDRRPTAASAAVIIRSAHSGACSGDPAGVRYPGVPTVDEVMAQAGVRPCDTTSEADWLRLCDAVCDE